MVHQVYTGIKFLRLGRISLMHYHAHIRNDAQEMVAVFFVCGERLIVAGGKQNLRP